MEKSPSPVYGARLELVYALIAHRGFESLLLRQKITLIICQRDFFYKYQSGYHFETASSCVDFNTGEVL